jgi:hypothetical protein
MYGWSWRDKLEAVVDRGGPDECWPASRASIDTDGYAHLGAADTDETLVHRMAVIADGRVIPPGHDVVHVADRCTRHDCANPAHLEIVTREESRRRVVREPVTVCIRGHDRSDAYPGGGCRKCKAEDYQARVAAGLLDRQKAERARRPKPAWHTPARLAAVRSVKRLRRLRERSTTHGMSRHPLRGTWKSMMDRCYKPKGASYKNYGGRGINVCERWHDLRTFITDIEREIGPRPPGQYPNGRPLYTLDRIDNDGNYEPGNVRWADRKMQKANQRKLVGQRHEPATGMPDTPMSCPACGEPMRSLSAFDKHRREMHGQPV